jgi:FAD:protein FMN transferase
VSVATDVRTSRYVEHAMGMPISLALRGRHSGDRHAREAWTEVMAQLHEVDRVFSTYRHDSYVSRLGRGEITLSDCPEEVAEVLELGMLGRVRSEGVFDVRRRAPDGTVVLDPSGVVKGWAVERASAHLRTLGETDFCLSAGGDMVCHTDDPDGVAWRVGIEDPHDTSRVLAVVPLTRGAVATSGSAHRGAHIVDARTGAAPRDVASVTVVASSLTWADIDATTAYALDGDAAYWLAAHGGVGLVVWRDGAVERVGPDRRVPTRPARTSR